MTPFGAREGVSRQVRFDDGLDTVLTAEMAGPAATRMMWRQAVDLIGRRRGGQRGAAIARLRAIRDDVPVATRIASARGLQRANPPADLVALFILDEPVVAQSIARIARLSANEWLALLPEMHPATRGMLRHRRDLPDRVVRALDSFGPSDFALPAGEMPAAAEAPEHAIVPVEAVPVAVWPPAQPMPALEIPVASPAPEPVPEVAQPAPVWPPVATPPAWDPVVPEVAEPAPPTFVAPEPSPFVAVADIARELPVVAEALRRERAEAAAPPPPVEQDFQIAEIVARIEAHQRAYGDRAPDPFPAKLPPPTRFRFETDAKGVIRWCEGVGRGPVIGLSLAAGRDGAPATSDASAAGALARRARFADARLSVPGTSPAAGAWRISASPVFDHASGRFTGYRGTARRPRPDEQPQVTGATAATDALRQLVHELRTPANAISGFAEMIEREMLGPVPPAYRGQAAAIRDQTVGLLGAIDDLDTAARIESHNLDLRDEAVPLAALLGRVVGDLQPLSQLRGARLALDVASGAVACGDARAIERLFSRLFAALLASAQRDEAVTATVEQDQDWIRCELSRPSGLVVGDRALFSGDADVETGGEGAPLLGGAFAFRLARRLATELGGTLAIGPERLTLGLPAAVTQDVEQATV